MSCVPVSFADLINVVKSDEEREREDRPRRIIFKESYSCEYRLFFKCVHARFTESTHVHSVPKNMVHTHPAVCLHESTSEEPLSGAHHVSVLHCGNACY